MLYRLFSLATWFVDLLLEYAYSAALTDIVAQVELLEMLTKTIVGEMALDAPDLIE